MIPTPHAPPFPWPDPAFEQNRRRWTWDQLQPWAGKHVAWAWDGTAILAGATTLAELYQELDRLGIDSQRIVFGYVDAPDEANL